MKNLTEMIMEATTIDELRAIPKTPEWEEADTLERGFAVQLMAIQTNTIRITHLEKSFAHLEATTVKIV